VNFVAIGLPLREALDSGQTPCLFERVFCCTGNELIYELTDGFKDNLFHRLRFDMWDWSSKYSRVAEYLEFRLLPEREKYVAFVGFPANLPYLEAMDGPEDPNKVFRIIDSQSSVISLTNVTMYVMQ